MNDFIQLFNSELERRQMHLEIYYSKVMDWCIKVYLKNYGTEEIITDVQHPIAEEAFSIAYQDLFNWINEKGGLLNAKT